MSPDREAALRASALLYEAEGKIAELTRERDDLRKEVRAAWDTVGGEQVKANALRERLAEAEDVLRYLATAKHSISDAARIVARHFAKHGA